MNRIRLASAIALVCALSAPLRAQVVNGGFESGMSGWSQFGLCVDANVDGVSPFTGSQAYFSGAVGDICTLTQTIATNIGEQYTFSFWLQNDGDPFEQDFNTAEALFGNQSVYVAFNAPAFGYTQKSFLVTANSTSTTLEFRFRNDASFWDMDDVSVTSAATTVPEPATVALMGAGLLGLAVARMRRRQS